MYHPLAEDITKLSVKEIELKLNDLYKKYRIAQHNPMLASQVHTLIQAYQMELETKMRKDVDAAKLDKYINKDIG